MWYREKNIQGSNKQKGLYLVAFQKRFTKFMKQKNYGYIIKHELMPIFGMYKFIYPQMCPVYLTKEKLWDELQ